MKYSQKDYLNALFKPEEIISIVGPQPTITAFNGAVNELQEPLKLDYCCINPLSGPRADINVSSYRNFLLEFDSIPLDVQASLCQALEKVIPIRTLTYSGSKSLHAVISLSDSLGYAPNSAEGVEAYKSTFKALRKAVEALLRPTLGPNLPESAELIDSANSNASRLTRLGEGQNNFWKYPGTAVVRQEVLNIGDLCTSEALMTFISQYKQEPAVISPSFQGIKGSFERTLRTNVELKGLRTKITCPQDWAGPQGNHTTIFRLTLWAIDATAVEQDEFLSYLKQHLMPYTASLGYANERVINAVKGAYNYAKVK